MRAGVDFGPREAAAVADWAGDEAPIRIGRDAQLGLRESQPDRERRRAQRNARHDIRDRPRCAIDFRHADRGPGEVGLPAIGENRKRLVVDGAEHAGYGTGHSRTQNLNGDHRHHSDDQSQRRQKRAGLVGPEHRQRFEHILGHLNRGPPAWGALRMHYERSAAIGSSRLARSAG